MDDQSQRTASHTPHPLENGFPPVAESPQLNPSSKFSLFSLLLIIVAAAETLAIFQLFSPRADPVASVIGFATILIVIASIAAIKDRKIFILRLRNSAKNILDYLCYLFGDGGHDRDQ